MQGKRCEAVAGTEAAAPAALVGSRCDGEQIARNNSSHGIARRGRLTVGPASSDVVRQENGQYDFAPTANQTRACPYSRACLRSTQRHKCQFGLGHIPKHRVDGPTQMPALTLRCRRDFHLQRPSFLIDGVLAEDENR